MFSKNPDKESLRQMLQAKCDNAMLLDNSVHKHYAAEQAPSKPPYRRKKKPQTDTYQQEILRLTQAHEKGTNLVAHGAETTVAPSAELDFQALENEAAAFMRSRHRK